VKSDHCNQNASTEKKKKKTMCHRSAHKCTSEELGIVIWLKML